MKIILVAILSIFFVCQTFAIGILKNSCFSVNKEGNLIRVAEDFFCSSTASESAFDKNKNSASGINSLAVGRYQIDVEGNGNTKKVFEIEKYSSSEDGSYLFSSVLLTTLSDGKINDHTTCSRRVSKDSPLTKTDGQKCLTINHESCKKLSEKVRANNLQMKDLIKSGAEKTLDEKELKKCGDLLVRAHKTFDDVFSYSGSEFRELAKQRYDEVKTYLDSKLPEKTKDSLKLAFNKSKTDSSSGLEEAQRDSFSGLSQLEGIYATCATFFPDDSAQMKSAKRTKNFQGVSSKNKEKNNKTKQ